MTSLNCLRIDFRVLSLTRLQDLFARRSLRTNYLMNGPINGIQLGKIVGVVDLFFNSDNSFKRNLFKSGVVAGEH